MSTEIKENTRALKSVTIDYEKSKIYKIVNSDNDMVYIGSTTQPLTKRMYCHRQRALTDTSLLYVSMKEIGVKQFKILLVEDYPCKSKSVLEAREFAVMNTYEKAMLYNSITNGHHSPETKLRISHALIGIKHSPEAKQNMSASRTGCKNWKFTRGSISDDVVNHIIRFQWYDNAVTRNKKFGYKNKRTREAAYMMCVDLRNAIFPLTFADYSAELPFDCHE